MPLLFLCLWFLRGLPLLQIGLKLTFHLLLLLLLALWHLLRARDMDCDSIPSNSRFGLCRGKRRKTVVQS